MHALEAIKEYEETQKDKGRLCSRVNWSNTQMSSSPISISSNSPTHVEVLDALIAAPTSSLTEARAAFPTPEPGSLSPDSTFSVDLDLSPAMCIDTIGVETEVGHVEGGTGAEDTRGTAEVFPAVDSRCTCGSDLPDAGPCTCRGYHCQGRSVVTCTFRDSIRTCNTALNVPSARASSRTANAMLRPLTGPRYFVRSKESWKQLVERICHHKSPELPSQHNNNNTLSDLPTAIQQSTEKRGRKSPRQHESEEDKGGDRTGGGEAHQRLSKCAKRCKGK